MAEHSTLVRAQHLMQLERFEEADELLVGFLVEEPGDPAATALRAEAALGRRETDRAIELAREAVGLDPTWDLTHFTLARALMVKRRNKAAEESIREAISLDPEDADNHALLAQILLLQSKHREALAAAEAGLSEDPDHQGCKVMQSHALMGLGRADEAQAAASGQLSRDPDDPDAHAAQGWAMLHSGRYRESCTHFREALRLDPDNEPARQGVREALKAHNPLYRPVLSFFLWMSRFSPRTQGLLVVGAWFGFRMVRRLQDSLEGDPAEAWAGPILTTLVVAYLVLVATSWFAVPFANAFLLLNPLGRLATRPRERLEALSISGLVVGGVLMWFFTPYPISGVLLVLFCAVLQASTQVRLDAGYPKMAAFMAAVFAFGAWIGYAEVRSVALGYDEAVLEELQAYDERGAELKARLDAQKPEPVGVDPDPVGPPGPDADPDGEVRVGLGTALDPELAQAIQEHAARRPEMEASMERLRPAIEAREPISNSMLIYAILCFWVSQILAGALAHKAELR